MRARVLSWAKPERFVTLTNAPDDWQRLRQKVRKLALNLRADGYSCEWAWTVEQGAKTGMRHVHLLQHGNFVPQATLQDRWGAITHITAIRGARRATGYAMKEATRVAAYALKESRADFLAHLDRNGGRPCHHSRGYLHGKRTRDVEAILRGANGDLHWFLVDCTESEAEVRARAAVILG